MLTRVSVGSSGLLTPSPIGRVGESACERHKGFPPGGSDYFRLLRVDMFC